jgi:hypothetical protein
MADIIGTIRSHLNVFINCFRKLRFILDNDRICVHKSLLNVVLHDLATGQDSVNVSLQHAEAGQDRSRQEGLEATQWQETRLPSNH